jgi:hypothetical protein
VWENHLETAGEGQSWNQIDTSRTKVKVATAVFSVDFPFPSILDFCLLFQGFLMENMDFISDRNPPGGSDNLDLGEEPTETHRIGIEMGVVEKPHVTCA